MSEGKKYTEQEFEQELIKRDVANLKKSFDQHIREEQKHWSDQNARLESVAEMVRSISTQIVDSRRNLEVDIRNDFMPRAEVVQMEERLDTRIDNVVEAIGTKLDSVTKELKADNAKIVIRVTGVLIGFTSAVSVIVFILKLTGKM